MSEGQTKSIPIDQLGIQELSSLSRQLEQELSFFTESLSELKEAQTKFRRSEESVNELKVEKKDEDAMIPLTDSMYVRGQLTKVDQVLIDIGTGYFVEMKAEKASDYFKRKQAYLQKQIEKIESILMEKQRSKSVISDVLQSKVQAAVAATASSAGQSSS